jgi:hypothetical protein
MALGLMPDFLLTEFANNGKPLAGGTIYFYESGTLVPKSVYSTAVGDIALGTSVTLSASGTAVIFLGTGAYRIWIKDANGVQIAPWVDGIIGAPTSGADGTNATFAVCLTYGDLRALTSAPDTVYVCGDTIEGDGGAGQFQKIPGSTLTDDGGIVLVSATNTVYKRVFDAEIDPEWYGLKYKTNSDQTTAINSVLNGSARWNFPVHVTQWVYINQNITVPVDAALRCGIGAFFVASGAITITFPAGTTFDAVGVAFGTNVQPIFGVGVCDAVRLSWMGDNTADVRWSKLRASISTLYQVLIDVDTTISSDPDLPVSAETDFVGGAKLTLNGATDINIPGLVYSGAGQIISYTSISYIQVVNLGAVTRPEWFGFVTGDGPTLDNTVSWKAAISSRSVQLLPNKVYFVKDTGTAYVLSNDVTITGGYRTYLQIEQTITATGVYVYSVILTGSGQLNSSGPSTYSSVQATDNLTLTSITPALVVGSTLNKIDNVGDVSGSTLSAFSGTLSGFVSGSSAIVLAGTISVPSSITVAESIISNPLTSPMFSLGTGVSISIDNSSVETAGLLCYSTDTTASIILNNCINSSSFSAALSNGYAKVYLNNSGGVGNATAYSINGSTQDASIYPVISVGAYTASNATTYWKTPFSITSDGTSITLGSASTFDTTPWGTNTLRWIGNYSDEAHAFLYPENAQLQSLFHLGGKITVTVEYPTGVAPAAGSQLTVALVIGLMNTRYTGTDDFLPWLHNPPNNVSMGRVTMGSSIPFSLPAITGAKAKLVCNVWGGQLDFHTPPDGGPYYVVKDEWGDAAFQIVHNDRIINVPRLIIYDAGGATIPSGTKFTVVVNPALPTTQQYAAFWPQTGWGLTTGYLGYYLSSQRKYSDLYSNLTFPYQFRSCDADGIQLAYVRNPGQSYTIPGGGTYTTVAVPLPKTFWWDAKTLKDSDT